MKVEINSTEMSREFREWWEHAKYIFNRMFGAGAAEKLMKKVCGHNHPNDSDCNRWYRAAYERERMWDKQWR
jgi:hypothetical protein